MSIPRIVSIGCRPVILLLTGAAALVGLNINNLFEASTAKATGFEGIASPTITLSVLPALVAAPVAKSI